MSVDVYEEYANAEISSPLQSMRRRLRCYHNINVILVNNRVTTSFAIKSYHHCVCLKALMLFPNNRFWILRKNLKDFCHWYEHVLSYLVVCRYMTKVISFYHFSNSCSVLRKILFIYTRQKRVLQISTYQKYQANGKRCPFTSGHLFWNIYIFYFLYVVQTSISFSFCNSFSHLWD